LTILDIFGPRTGKLYRKPTFFEKLHAKNEHFLNEIHEKRWKIVHFWPKKHVFWLSKTLKPIPPSYPTINHGFSTSVKKKDSFFGFFVCFFLNLFCFRNKISQIRYQSTYTSHFSIKNPETPKKHGFLTYVYVIYSHVSTKETSFYVKKREKNASLQ
jgi:hypothetical protein